MPGVRSYAVENFMLALDGVQCGYVKSVGGGDVYAEVVQEAAGPSFFFKKHIAGTKYEDFSVQIGFGMAQVVYDWISASWAANYQRKDGSIVAADYTLKAQSERQFFHALLTETTIPALDASWKEPAYLTIKFAPEFTKTVKGKGRLGVPAKQQQKLFLPSNFRLELDGLDCTQVNGVRRAQPRAGRGAPGDPAARAAGGVMETKRSNASKPARSHASTIGGLTRVSRAISGWDPPQPRPLRISLSGRRVGWHRAQSRGICRPCCTRQCMYHLRRCWTYNSCSNTRTPPASEM